MPYGPTIIRVTAVKPYAKDEAQEIERPDSSLDSDSHNTDDYSPIQYNERIGTTMNPENLTRRGRGRQAKGLEKKLRHIQETLFKVPLFNILAEIGSQTPNLNVANEIFNTVKEVPDEIQRTL
ncbi:hypothetical protein OnM2_087032 [Erysiphe neolycopersici]|uniref:Uncharacterized protein n=1 Tax=Erysiphe neolycopersici TaxID=212602 RepID=A0A420HEA3_9PEZI|nr:hypothetical protein OnM2_087032 [Erysiphe neolycopersici]